MFYKPNELKLVPLREVPVGAIARMPGWDHLPLVIRLADTTQGIPRLMALGGEQSFGVGQWQDDNPLALIVCDAATVRFKLGAQDANHEFRNPGAITLREGGAIIGAFNFDRRSFPFFVETTEWSNSESNLQQNFAVYQEWEFGRIDQKGEFVSIFKRENPVR